MQDQYSFNNLHLLVTLSTSIINQNFLLVEQRQRINMIKFQKEMIFR